MFGPIFQVALAKALLHSLWQEALLALLAAAALRLARRSAAHRHLIGMTFLTAMLLVPLLTLLAGLSSADEKLSPVFLAQLGTDARATLVTRSSSPLSALWLGWLWALGVGAMLVRLLAGFASIRLLDHQSFKPLPPVWQMRLETLRHSLGIRRNVTIRLLDAPMPPCTARALRPVIWLPVSILTGLSSEQIEAVIAHELAHIRRLDWVWNGLQCGIETLLFYHPAMWWLSRRIREERENACDDLAASACGDPIVLAEALTLLARLRPPLPHFALSTNGSPLMKRIARLLTPRPREPFSWKLPLGLFALTCSGAVLALNTAPAVQRQLDHRVEAPEWWEAFGDAMDINSKIDGKQRRYRRWHDLHGKPHESYAVDGRLAPIDAGVRQWLARGRAQW